MKDLNKELGKNEILFAKVKIREEDFDLRECYDIFIANCYFFGRGWEEYDKKADSINEFIKEKKERGILVPNRKDDAVHSCEEFEEITSLLNYNVSLGHLARKRMNGNKLDYAFVFNVISREDLTEDLNELCVPYTNKIINDSRKIKLSVFQIEDLAK